MMNTSIEDELDMKINLLGAKIGEDIDKLNKRLNELENKLTDPRPKREYKEGSFYLVTFHSNNNSVVEYVGRKTFKTTDTEEPFGIENFKWISKNEIPPELWESES